MLLVPGGGGCLAAIENDAFLREIVRLGATARYLTSVCTGSLILGAAGFLTGRRAACHWAWRELLPAFGAIVDEGRIVRDGNILIRGRRHGRHRFRAGTYRGAARPSRGRDGPARLGICATTALQLRTAGHRAGGSPGSGERTRRRRAALSDACVLTPGPPLIVPLSMSEVPKHP